MEYALDGDGINLSKHDSAEHSHDDDLCLRLYPVCGIAGEIPVICIEDPRIAQFLAKCLSAPYLSAFEVVALDCRRGFPNTAGSAQRLSASEIVALFHR